MQDINIDPFLHPFRAAWASKWAVSGDGDSVGFAKISKYGLIEVEVDFNLEIIVLIK